MSAPCRIAQLRSPFRSAPLPMEAMTYARLIDWGENVVPLQYQVEAADLCGGFEVSGRGLQGDNHAIALGRGDTPENVISLLMGIVGKVHLGRQIEAVGAADFDVDV